MLLILGRRTLTCLEEAEIKCSYVLINSVSYIIKEVLFARITDFLSPVISLTKYLVRRKILSKSKIQYFFKFHIMGTKPGQMITQGFDSAGITAPRLSKMLK